MRSRASEPRLHVPPSVQPGSTWSDARTGVTEEAAFLGPDGSRFLAFLHRPQRDAVVGGMLLCSSLYQDLDLNYRSELLVARALAARGIATVRFHYRGTGNSDDVGGGVTFSSMVADARAAVSWLVDRTAVTRPSFCGFRLGALVAAELARREEGTPLALWAPVPSGAEYYRGLSRASMVAGIRAEGGRRQAGTGVEQQLAHQESVQMLGNLVHRATYDDVRNRTLPPDLGRGRQILLVQVGLSDGNPQYEALTSGWTAGGAQLDVLKIRMRQLWMVPDMWEPEEQSPTTQQLVDGIVDWAVGTAAETVP